ncbi:MAG TPA: tetratricopeptide repeat protein [Thermoanaerobaculia bacterium]|jgi:tetratricopeptide (TPR) repeat protein|nr:tetratricopeptide repeat protein [Thermoanaerobaculia bacterium]
MEKKHNFLAKWTAILFVVLLVNTAYLSAFASPTVFYMGNVLIHLVLGLALAVGFGLLLARRPDLRSGLLPAAALFFLALLAGVWLATAGNVLQNRPVFWAHVVTAALAVALFGAWLWRRRAPEGTHPRFRQAFAAAVALLVLWPAGAALWRKANPNPTDRIKNPLIVPTSMHEEGGGPKSPFFPSSAKTNVGGIIPSNFFMDSATCGECHKDIYEQWNSSAHHFASFNNQFYRKSIEYMQDVVGTQPSKWCAGCHDHAVFFNGRFERPIKEQLDTPEAHAGLACTSCHAITHVDSSMGNGGFTIEYPPLHELANSKNPVIRKVDHFLTYLDPEPHKKTFMKPFMRVDSAEFCSTCHKVHLDVPVNSYRWFRGFNDYDNWQASAVSGQGARSFYYPAESKTCANCHMPLVESNDPGNRGGKVHSHRFPAANTALAFVNKDQKQMDATEKFLKSGFITVDIFAVSPVEEGKGETAMVRRAGEGPQLMSTFAVGEEAEQAGTVFIRDVGKIAAPFDKAAPAVKPGSTVKVDVVVRTRAIGHFFPGGTVDAFDVWLELQGKDADGKVVFWSGQVEDDGKGPVEPGAHFYRSYQLDGEGNPINKRNAWQARSVLYVRMIPPGAADVAHYRVRVPEDAKGPLTFTAKLNYRKFAHYYTQFAYAGQPKPGQDPGLISPRHNSLEYSFDKANIPANVSGKIKGEIPNLPIVTLATAEAKLPLAGDAEPVWKPVAGKKDRERWNDYGIGLLLQGDLKGAEHAFKKVTEAEPGYADGWLNVARALIREGEVEAARPYIQKALAVDSSLARIHFFKAMIEKTQGDYDAALASLRTVEAKYPRDRVVLNQMARILFLKRQYKEAIQVLERVCAVDPEDVQMHYTAMLSWRALGNQEKAAREAKLFRRFKAEESAQAITARRRMLSPEDNNERQPIHEHESAPLNTVPRTTAESAIAGG